MRVKIVYDLFAREFTETREIEQNFSTWEALGVYCDQLGANELGDGYIVVNRVELIEGGN